jgi:pimeloyl-ACP methyl ester carboxylesterase
MLSTFRFKKVDPTALQHPIEKRGFVTVPFDYGKPNGETIDIFYRLIPAYSSKPDDASKPIIVVVNGGPGIPSSAYRALDFDYSAAIDAKDQPFNRFKFLLNDYRILIADQRGTDGQSAPLDMLDPNLNANGVARYFSSDSQARDYLAVIEKVIPANERFYMIAQSYGGMVGMQYLSLSSARKPQGIVFSCSALPYEDVKDASLSRRLEQLDLNRQLQSAYPDIEKRLSAVRTHLQSLDMDPNQIHSLYSLLGKYEKGIWEKSFVDHLDGMLKKNKAELEKQFQENLGSGNMLNYILSSSNFTPGHTDRTIARLTSKEIPFESWMIDENWVLMQTGSAAPEGEKIISKMDQNPPPPTPFLKTEKLREKIAQHQLLFTSADNDAFVPAESYQRAFKKFWVEGHTQTEHLPGGHHAIFLEEGHRTFLKWAKKLS